MVHVKDLSLNILERVFWYYYHEVTGERNTLHAFKQLLPPAAVCHAWRGFMLQYIYDAAYLECHRKRHSLLGQKNNKSEYVWNTNIDLILSQGLADEVKQLRIVSSRRVIDLSTIFRVLENSGFTSKTWFMINKLQVVGHLDHENPRDSHALNSTGDDALAKQLTQCFVRHTPNLRHLQLVLDISLDISRMFADRMVNAYFEKLQTLDAGFTPITFNRHSYASPITHLNLKMNTAAANTLPHILAPTLESLTLRNIQSGFSWRTFVSDTPGYTTFASLRKLSLYFDSPVLDNTGQPEDSERDDSHRSLLFPKLKSLVLKNNPFTAKSFYSAFAQSPLSYLNITGSLASMKNLDARSLLNLSYLIINITEVLSTDEYSDFAWLTKKLFSSNSTVRTAILRVADPNVRIQIPNSIGWTSVQNLSIYSELYLSSFIRLTTHLDRLKKLVVTDLFEDFDDTDATLRNIITKGPVYRLVSSTSITRLSIIKSQQERLPITLDVLYCLLLLIRSLKKVNIPTNYVYDVKSLVAKYSDSFPHLRRIGIEKN